MPSAKKKYKAKESALRLKWYKSGYTGHKRKEHEAKRGVKKRKR